jgi:hypothetical protein
MGLRVEEEGESECRSVMGRIGVATSSHAQAGRLPSGVGGRERSANRRRGRRRSVGRAAMALAGAASTTEITSVAGSVSVTFRLNPRPMGQPRPPDGVGVGQCLSCLRGNQHEQFLGGGGTAMCPCYPTSRRRPRCWCLEVRCLSARPPLLSWVVQPRRHRLFLGWVDKTWRSRS